MYDKQDLPDDLPEEIKTKLSGMTHAEAAAWLVLNGEQARAAAAHNSALASMSEQEQEVARLAGMTPEDYVRYRRVK